jgi:hypothetical protein
MLLTDKRYRVKQVTMKKSLCVLAFCVLAVGTVSIASGPHTGIEGQVFLQKSDPPPAQFPMAACFNILTARNRNPVCRVITDANGSFKLSLHPGTYLLVPENVMVDPSLNCMASTDPIEVTVRSRSYTVVNILYPMPCTSTPPQTGSEPGSE